jgi:hypothetical protein
MAQLKLWRLQRLESESDFHLLTPSQCVEPCGYLDVLLDRLRPVALMAVGWHTWSEQAAWRAQCLNIPVVFSSHGVGCCVLYRLRPFAGLICFLVRSPALFGVIRTLRGLDALVVACLRRCWWDSRSLDAALAKRLGCMILTIANPIDIEFWTRHWKPPVQSPLAAGFYGPLGMVERPFPGFGNLGTSSIAE